jgi:hypothetical protein
VNINSTNSEVIAAAFSGCPSDEDDATSASLIYDQAGAQNDSLDLAEELISGQPYTNVASIGDAGVVDWEAYATAMGTDSSDFEREALIRNTAELLTARHNLFTVIVRADSFSEGMGGDASKGMTLASARAVAEIWRDPIPDENGRNRCLIRSFRFIED